PCEAILEMREFTTPRRGEAVRDHQCLSRAVVRCGEQFEQFERAPAVGPGGRGADSKAGECGIGEREHARVYPRAVGWPRPASKTNACVLAESGERRR